MMKYPAIIFDMDGTLTDSQPGILGGIRYALQRVGFDVPEESVLRTYVGPPLSNSFMGGLGMDEAQFLRALEGYREYYYERGYLENAVYPGIRVLLQTLRDAGAWLGIASNKPRESTLRILRHFDILRYFDEVAGPGPGPRDEPTKAELIARANPKGLPAVMIGDREVDVRGAREAGIPCVAVQYGYGDMAELSGAGAETFAEKVSDLYPLLGLKEPAPRGYFISLEGNDGSGKSTQAKLLAAHLTQIGYDVLLTREPGGTALGEAIRGILLDAGNTGMDAATEALLYAAARAQHVSQVIRPALTQGKIVVTDRYVDSSVAYQGAGRELGIHKVREMNDFATGGLLPNLTLFIRLSPEEGLRRRVLKREPDRLEREGADFHRRAAAAFDAMAADNHRFITIESREKKADTARAVADAVTQRLRGDGMP